MTQTFPDFDTREDFLEDHYEEDVARCEVDHSDIAATTPCSHKVTHRLVMCDCSTLCCANAAQYAFDALSKIGDGPLVIKCPSCRRPATTCWSVIPV